MKADKLCINCNNYMDEKPLPRCKSSRFMDLVTGAAHRTCLIERIDGIGRCSSMANNYSEKKPEPPKRMGRPPKE